MKNSTFQSNQSVEKVLQIIETLAMNHGPMRLQDISEKLNIPGSTAMRFLKTLVQQNYVSQSPETLRYALTLKVCHIGDLAGAQFNIRDVARPALRELSARFGESSCLAIEENLSAVYLDVAEGADSILKVTQRIGKIAPLHCSGVGKSLLLSFSAENLDRLIAERGLPRLTDHTITTKEALLEELARIRQAGVSLDLEECELGASCIAAPIRDYTGRVAASISVTGPTSRMTREKMALIEPVLLEKAAQISAQLAY